VCILAHSMEYLWWVQLVGYLVEVLEMYTTKMPALAIEDRVRVTMISGTMLSVHTTYPL
jgi:hypothetical protein